MGDDFCCASASKGITLKRHSIISLKDGDHYSGFFMTVAELNALREGRTLVKWIFCCRCDAHARELRFDISASFRSTARSRF